MTPAIQLAAPLVRKSEGLQLSAYLCPAGKWTIGYGHTGPDVKRGMTIIAGRAEELLSADLAVAAAAVRRLVRVPLTAHQEATLIDFVFNLGEGNLAGSTLLRRLNDGLYDHVPAQLRRWTKGVVNGVMKELSGLVIRREAECVLWDTAA